MWLEFLYMAFLVDHVCWSWITMGWNPQTWHIIIFILFWTSQLFWNDYLNPCWVGWVFQSWIWAHIKLVHNDYNYLKCALQWISGIQTKVIQHLQSHSKLCTFSFNIPRLFIPLKASDINESGYFAFWDGTTAWDVGWKDPNDVIWYNSFEYHLILTFYDITKVGNEFDSHVPNY